MKALDPNTTSKKVKKRRFGHLSNLTVKNNLVDGLDRDDSNENNLLADSSDEMSSIHLKKRAKLEVPSMIDFKYQAINVPFMSDFEIKNVGEKKVNFRFSCYKNFLLKPMTGEIDIN